MKAAASAPDQGAAEPTPAGALSQLIRAANDAGVTYQEMADRGIDPDGNKLPRQWYQKLVKTPPVNPPSVSQMHAIAAAIGQPFRRVQEATARQWLQFEATDPAGYDEDTLVIVAHLAGKTPGDKRRWRMMIEAEAKALREADE